MLLLLLLFSRIRPAESDYSGKSRSDGTERILRFAVLWALDLLPELLVELYREAAVIGDLPFSSARESLRKDGEKKLEIALFYLYL